jgi:hypothetical protein
MSKDAFPEYGHFVSQSLRPDSPRAMTVHEIRKKLEMLPDTMRVVHGDGRRFSGSWSSGMCLGDGSGRDVVDLKEFRAALSVYATHSDRNEEDEFKGVFVQDLRDGGPLRPVTAIAIRSDLTVCIWSGYDRRRYRELTRYIYEDVKRDVLKRKKRK